MTEIEVPFWINLYEDKRLGLHYSEEDADDEANLEESLNKHNKEPPRFRLGKAQKFTAIGTHHHPMSNCYDMNNLIRWLDHWIKEATYRIENMNTMDTEYHCKVALEKDRINSWEQIRHMFVPLMLHKNCTWKDEDT